MSADEFPLGALPVLTEVVQTAPERVGSSARSLPGLVGRPRGPPQLGSIAHLGKDNEAGAKLAIEEVNAKKLNRIGGQKIKFELLPEDDAADPKQGTAAAQKLVDAKVAGVIGHLNSGTTIPASRVYSDAGIPQISPRRPTRSTPARASRRPSAWWPTTCTWVARWASTPCLAQGQVDRVIDDRTAYGMGVANEFEKAVKAAGGKIIGREFTTDKATDFNAILTTLKGKSPDVVFFGGMDAVAGPMLRQMKQLGIKRQVHGRRRHLLLGLPKLAGEVRWPTIRCTAPKPVA
jgi:branched-chain amino acid transport system substrate-binding protein